MSPRRARLVFEPLDGWDYPDAAEEASPFSAKWTATRDLLLAEGDHLGVEVLVVELDLTRADLRQDGEIRANARLRSGRVRISMDSRHGAMRYACDRYLPPRAAHFGSAWQHNARAIALTLQALRAVDRYGAVHSAEQYRGFMAIEAAAPRGFVSADEAMRWLYQQADGHDDSADETPRGAYRAAVRRLHPDAGGDPDEWARLDLAVQLLRKAGLL